MTRLALDGHACQPSIPTSASCLLGAPASAVRLRLHGYDDGRFMGAAPAYELRWTSAAVA